ncbi:MAG: RNA-directed DNA polymerase [Saprospiraceae bacterium]|nr:RNA-directed DNA polymerase [Saprospiraceae bacterium]
MNILNLQNASNRVQFCKVLAISEDALKSALANHKYYTFKVTKKNGKLRKIEDPNDERQYVQQRLSFELYPLYKTVLPPYVHGYIPTAISQNGSRSILSNAEAHLNCNFMVNLDLLDFFHQITISKIRGCLSKVYKIRSLNIIDLIVKIACYEGRLPMGSPCSPVLSNMIVIDLDGALFDYCQAQNITYTRYVDDLSFSSKLEITGVQIETLKKIILNEGFLLNEEKFRIFHQNDPKKVTGLVVHQGKLDVSDDYLNSLSRNIKKLKRIKRTYQHMRMLHPELKTNLQSRYRLIKSSVAGQLSFVQRILQPEDERCLALAEEFDDARTSSEVVDLHLYF